LSNDLRQTLERADSALRGLDYSGADQLYQDALVLDEKCAAAYFGIGTIALKQNRQTDALAALEQATIIAPEAPDFAFNYGCALSNGGNKIEALIEFQRTSKYCRDDPVFCAKLSEVFLQLGEPLAAIQMLSRMSSLLPRDQLVLADAHGALNCWKESVNVLRRLSDELAKDPVVAGKLSIAAANYRDFDTAVLAFERFLRLVTPSANDYLRFADLLLLAQRLTRCQQAIDMASELGEDGAQIHLLQAKLFRLSADYAGAKEALDCVLERESNLGQAWTMRAELADSKDVLDSIPLLEAELAQEHRVSKLSSQQQALLYYALGSLCERAERYGDAAVAFKRANSIQQDALARVGSFYVAEKNHSDTDQIIARFSEKVMAAASAPTPAGVDSKQPIFILGVPRSGTTLVERMLGQNNKVFNAGELPGMEFVASDLLLYQRSGRLPNTSEITADQWVELRESYLKKLPDMSQSIFTDKLPHNFRNVGLILKLFPNARIIQMHRARRDVCLSIFCHAFTGSHNYATSLHSIDHFCSQAERLMAHWSTIQPDNIFDLNYDDLVRQPEQFGKELVEFCGLSWDSNYLEFHQSINQSFTFSEIQVRQPITTTRVDRWRKYYSVMPELSQLDSA